MVELITYYPNGLPYIVEYRTYGKRKCTVYIYDATGQEINILRYVNDQIRYISYLQNNLLHNEHGPACIEWHINLQVYYIEYRKNNTQHNLHGPAYINWSNGKIDYIAYCQNGLQHNLHGIAYINWSNGKIDYIEYSHFGKLIKKFTFKI